jgi:hypothetical protein
MKIQVRLGPKPTMTHVHPEVPGVDAMKRGVQQVYDQSPPLLLRYQVFPDRPITGVRGNPQ